MSAYSDSVFFLAHLGPLWILFWDLAVALGAFAVGHAFLRRFHLPYARAAALLVGLILYCTAILFLGWMHLLYNLLIQAMVVFTALWGGWTCRGVLIDLAAQFKAWFFRQAWVEQALTWLGIGLFVFHIFQSLLPLFLGDPSFHLFRDYAEAHYFVFRPDIWMVLLPMGYYGWAQLAYGLYDLSLGAGMMVLQLLGICLLLAGFARRVLSERVIPYAWVILLSMPMVLSSSRAVREEIIDLAMALMLFVYLFEAWRSDSATGLRKKAMAFVILLGCFALGGKVTSIALFLSVVLLCLLWVGCQQNKRESFWFCVQVTVLGSVLFIVPWLLRAYVYTGNPVWPRAYEIFGGPYWAADGWQNFYKYQLPFKYSMAEIARLPYLFCKAFEADRPAGTSCGILVLTLGFPAVLCWGRHAALRLLVFMFASFFVLAYLLLVPTDRYFAAAYLFLLLAALFSLDFLVFKSRVGRLWVLLIFWGVSVFEIGLNVTRWINPDFSISRMDMVQGVFDLNKKRAVLYAGYPDQQVGDYMSAYHQDGKGILVIGGRAFRYRSPAYDGDPVIQYWIDYRSYHTAADLIRALQDRNIGYIALSDAIFEGDYFFKDFPATKQLIYETVASMRVIYHQDGVNVYAFP